MYKYNRCPYYYNKQSMYDSDNMYDQYKPYPYPRYVNRPMYTDWPDQFANQFPLADIMNDECLMRLKDYGPEPFVVDINEVTKQNNTFRTALWTGDHLQLTLMSIDVCDDIGLEMHPSLDQFIRIEEGQGLVMMGDRKDRLNFQKEVYDDFALIIPAGKWHNLVNTGNTPLKLYSIYAPPQHPYGTIHKTKADAIAAEKKHHHR